jgi:membrane-bound serine protease (ClpP class)
MANKIFRLIALAAIPILYLILRPYMIEWAEDWEWALLVVGIFLLGLEVLVIPGFGVAGISAFVLMYAGLVLVLINNKGFDFSMASTTEIARAMLVGGILLGLVLLALVALLPQVLRSNSFQDMTNNSALHKEQGFVALQNLPKMVGKTGTTETILRPSGKILIDNEIYDATTQGDFIEKGLPIVVVGQDGSALRVKKS